MKPYSLDLRQRIVTAVVDKQLHPEEVAERFSVSRDTVERYVQRALTGALAPQTSPGRPRVIGPEHHQALRAQLEAHADATLAAHCQRWTATQGVEVSTATMSRAIKRLGWTRKKRRWQPASGTRRRDSTGVLRWPTSIPAASSS
jgi:transposase